MPDGENPNQTNVISEVVRNVAYCPQKPFVVGGTVRDNILLGRENDEAQLNLAATRADFLTDVNNMNGGFDAELGERGLTLSGGQQARLNFARALYG